MNMYLDGESETVITVTVTGVATLAKGSRACPCCSLLCCKILIWIFLVSLYIISR